MLICATEVIGCGLSDAYITAAKGYEGCLRLNEEGGSKQKQAP